ncbi:MAG: L-seryl-tRNA(Sec) selenium transferase [Firmicutes bacterium]|nr:L-seryl-tRNA(Sec) selenium transferase [Bacillota bacterium]
MGKELLRQLPKVGTLLEQPQWQELIDKYRRGLVRSALDQELNLWRRRILDGGGRVPDADELLAAVSSALADLVAPAPRPVLNATGVVIHTNLGRAPLAPEAVNAAREAADYCDLEFDIDSGQRGSRHRHAEELICRITGAEAALVVNNNAAAVMLCLAAVARGGEAIISRGQLVEIGGAFRVPDVMEQSGVTLREVGTTNKTYLDDYRRAVTPETRALIRVHPSNFRVVGFNHEVSLAELVALGQEQQLPVLDDLGSGTLVDLRPWGIEEPTVQESVKAGADLISFSGDKLLGGPQCGIIVGSVEWIGRLKKHPLTRALRCDKLTLAALTATLALYLQEEGWRRVPVLRMITESGEAVAQRAQKLADLLAGLPLSVTVDADISPVGGGALPLHRLETTVLRLRTDGLSADQLAERLRAQRLVGRIADEQVVLDAKTLADGQLTAAATAVAAALGGE